MESRTDAQQRADAIRAFQAELARLEREGALALTPEQRERLDAHHASVLAGLDAAFDIDRSAEQATLSMGMRVASFLGACALSASVFFLFRQFWGRLGTPLQVLILIAAAVLSLVGTLAVRRRDASNYFTNLAAMVAFACFVLDLALLGQIFNVKPSPEALLVWGAYGLLLAYALDLRLLLAAGLVCLGAWVAARTASLAGLHWGQYMARPEDFFVPAVAASALPRFVAHHRHPLFPPIYRSLGMVAGFLAILALSFSGELSYLRIDADWIEAAYQWSGFALAAGAAWLGIRRGWNECVNIGTTFFVVLLVMKFVDWWWETMPRYLFFLVIGLTAILAIMVLRRMRAAASAAPRGEAA